MREPRHSTKKQKGNQLKMKCKTWRVFFWVCCIVLLTGCSLPTYHLYDPGVPSQEVSAFLDAVITGHYEKANERLYNSVWVSDSDSGMYSAEGTLVSENDTRLMQCINESRQYEIVSESDYSNDAPEARVTVKYTVFSVPAFQSELSSDVVQRVKAEQYNGTQFESAADTAALIENRKAALLQTPENYYSTGYYTVRLVRYKGQWRIVLPDAFYQALCGRPLEGGNDEGHQ